VQGFRNRGGHFLDLELIDPVRVAKRLVTAFFTV
jgi:hypothetical protein